MESLLFCFTSLDRHHMQPIFHLHTFPVKLVQHRVRVRGRTIWTAWDVQLCPAERQHLLHACRPCDAVQCMRKVVCRAAGRGVRKGLHHQQHVGRCRRDCDGQKGSLVNHHQSYKISSACRGCSLQWVISIPRSIYIYITESNPDITIQLTN